MKSETSAAVKAADKELARTCYLSKIIGVECCKGYIVHGGLDSY